MPTVLNLLAPHEPFSPCDHHSRGLLDAGLCIRWACLPCISFNRMAQCCRSGEYLAPDLTAAGRADALTGSSAVWQLRATAHDLLPPGGDRLRVRRPRGERAPVDVHSACLHMRLSHGVAVWAGGGLGPVLWEGHRGEVSVPGRPFTHIRTYPWPSLAPAPHLTQHLWHARAGTGLTS
jgi:hypothetical protein